MEMLPSSWENSSTDIYSGRKLSSLEYVDNAILSEDPDKLRTFSIVWTSYVWDALYNSKVWDLTSSKPSLVFPGLGENMFNYLGTSPGDRISDSALV